jgi:hypothetical protein
MNAQGVPVPQVIVPSRMVEDVALDAAAIPAVLGVVAIIIIDGIILLTGET